MADLQRARELVRELKEPLDLAYDKHPRSALLKHLLFTVEGLAYSLYRAEQGEQHHVILAAWWLGKAEERAHAMNIRQQPDIVVQAVNPWAINTKELLDLLTTKEG